MAARPDDQQPPEAHKAWFTVWKTRRMPEAARRAWRGDLDRAINEARSAGLFGGLR